MPRPSKPTPPWLEAKLSLPSSSIKLFINALLIIVLTFTGKTVLIPADSPPKVQQQQQQQHKVDIR